MKIYLHKPLGDLKILFWDMAQRCCAGSELVEFPEEADVIVIDNPDIVSEMHREGVDVVVVGAEPPQVLLHNVFFIRNHERMLWYLQEVPKRSHTAASRP